MGATSSVLKAPFSDLPQAGTGERGSAARSASSRGSVQPNASVGPGILQPRLVVCAASPPSPGPQVMFRTRKRCAGRIWQPMPALRSLARNSSSSLPPGILPLQLRPRRPRRHASMLFLRRAAHRQHCEGCCGVVPAQSLQLCAQTRLVAIVPGFALHCSDVRKPAPRSARLPGARRSVNVLELLVGMSLCLPAESAEQSAKAAVSACAVASADKLSLPEAVAGLVAASRAVEAMTAIEVHGALSPEAAGAALGAAFDQVSVLRATVRGQAAARIRRPSDNRPLFLLR